MKMRIILVVMALATALAGCGSDGEPTDNGGAAAGEAGEDSGSGGSKPASGGSASGGFVFGGSASGGSASGGSMNGLECPANIAEAEGKDCSAYGEGAVCTGPLGGCGASDRIVCTDGVWQRQQALIIPC